MRHQCTPALVVVISLSCSYSAPSSHQNLHEKGLLELDGVREIHSIFRIHKGKNIASAQKKRKWQMVVSLNSLLCGIVYA